MEVQVSHSCRLGVTAALRFPCVCVGSVSMTPVSCPAIFCDVGLGLGHSHAVLRSNPTSTQPPREHGTDTTDTQSHPSTP